MKITTVGIDFAKNVFQVHGVDERGKAVLKKQIKRNQMASFFANLPACLIGMEADLQRSSYGEKIQRPHLVGLRHGGKRPGCEFRGKEKAPVSLAGA